MFAITEACLDRLFVFLLPLALSSFSFRHTMSQPKLGIIFSSLAQRMAPNINDSMMINYEQTRMTDKFSL